MLIGASDYHNIFQRPDLVEHLEKLALVNGNYIRNTMASREILVDHRDLWPYEIDWDHTPFPHQSRDPLRAVYDLDRWNEVYWERFETLVEETARLEIILEIEIWERHDFYRTRDQAGWLRNPYNPDNNVNYTADESELPTGEWETDPGHPFFSTLPALDNNEVVLRYQQRFVDKILSYTFEFDHVKYNMNNETRESNEWGEYWAEYIFNKANEKGIQVELTDMQDAHDVTDESVARMMESELFTFVDISQNNFQAGDLHWERIQYIRNYLKDNPKPITNIKVYGSDVIGWGYDQDAVERFWRNILGGTSSTRFHRPPWGIGLNEIAQAHVKSASMFVSEMNIFKAIPSNHLLLNREFNSVYAIANPGHQYAVYFPKGGNAELQFKESENDILIRWLDLSSSTWIEDEYLQTSDVLSFSAPDKSNWIAIITIE
jgi:hypothetical protein